MLNPQILPLQKWGDAGFDESKVKRGDDGKFSEQAGGGGAPSSSERIKGALDSVKQTHAELTSGGGGRPDWASDPPDWAQGLPNKEGRHWHQKYGWLNDKEVGQLNDRIARLNEKSKETAANVRAQMREHGVKPPENAQEAVARATRRAMEEHAGNRILPDGSVQERRGRFDGALRSGLRGSIAGAGVGAGVGAALGSRFGRGGANLGARAGAVAGTRLGGAGGTIYGALSPGYRDTGRNIYKANAFDDFLAPRLRKRTR